MDFHHASYMRLTISIRWPLCARYGFIGTTMAAEKAIRSRPRMWPRVRALSVLFLGPMMAQPDLVLIVEPSLIVLGPCGVEPARAVRGFEHLHPLRLEVHPTQQPDRRFVVDHENACRHCAYMPSLIDFIFSTKYANCSTT